MNTKPTERKRVFEPSLLNISSWFFLLRRWYRIYITLGSRVYCDFLFSLMENSECDFICHSHCVLCAKIILWTTRRRLWDCFTFLHFLCLHKKAEAMINLFVLWRAVARNSADVTCKKKEETIKENFPELTRIQLLILFLGWFIFGLNRFSLFTLFFL